MTKKSASIEILVFISLIFRTSCSFMFIGPYGFKLVSYINKAYFKRKGCFYSDSILGFILQESKNDRLYHQ